MSDEQALSGGKDAAPVMNGATAQVSVVEERLFIVPVRVEVLLLFASIYWALTANRSFFDAALKNQALTDPGTWGFAVVLGILLIAVHFLVLGIFVSRWTVRPVLIILSLCTAVAGYYMNTYGVYLDPSMLRNVLRTDVEEARELLSWGLLAEVTVYGILPALVLWRVRIVSRPVWRSLGVRMASLLLAFIVAVAAALVVYKPLSSLFRKQKEVRYLVTPANYLWSLGFVLAKDARGASGPLQPIGLDAVAGPSWAARSKPLLLVLVVGETARAANWGLNGYARQTTPQLASMRVINFRDVSSCGTDTEVSLPCMFAPIGRREYHEGRISRSESLLHLLARAGVGVHWRDNQSGCKGVCEGLSADSVLSLNPPGMCSEARCFDGGLLHGLDTRLLHTHGVEMLVLHQLGNHGPSYFRRYPPAFGQYQPACTRDDLSQCTREEIVNAYDNALLYTDYVLAALIAKLQEHADRIDSAVLYVSDHGESLGENNLFLHGIPYVIAPEEQKKVPMILWLSDGFLGSGAIDEPCVVQRARQPASHDHLFHTVLGMLDVQTGLYERDWDLLAQCRGPVAAAG